MGSTGEGTARPALGVRHPPPTAHTETGSPAETGDVEPQSCLWVPCITDLADASAAGKVPAGRFGQGIAILGGPDAVAIVGGPADPSGAYGGYSSGEAVELTLPGLVRSSVWPTDTPWDYSTEAMSLREDPAGGYLLAVGAMSAHGALGRTGAVYLLRDELPSGESLQAGAYATISGDGAGFSAGGQIALGAEVHWLTVSGIGASELVVAAPGTTPLPGDTVPDGAAIYAFDSSMTGSLDVFDADRKITAPKAGFGFHIAGWDGDSDGIKNLVATQGSANGSHDRVLAFSSPWVNDLTVDDATAAWTLESSNVVDRIVDLGDVTGDGVPDLFTGAATWSGDGFARAGAAWVVPGGNLTGGSMLDAAIHLYGDEDGEGVGYDATGGDFDGDGNVDLIVGCYGLSPAALPGKIVLFLGPVPDGALDESVSDSVVHGEYPFDQFGMNLESLDVESDGVAELLVGAPGADRDMGRVYLLGSDALLQ